MTVAILGASDKPQRYSYRVLRLLLEHGHEVIPVHPTLQEIDGVPVLASLTEVDRKIDTLTVYLRPELAEPLVDALRDLAPRRVIFNPGTESTSLTDELQSAGIETEEACTLVLLQTGQF
jgi:predicted CoA-binding protein